MKIICKENCSGKTKELIRESLDKDIPILVFNEMKRRSLEEKAMAYFTKHVRTLTLEEAKQYSGDILIDDIDKNISSIIRGLTGNSNIDVATITLSA